MNIGFVGLGFMGLPMARRLIAAGHELHIVSRNAVAVAELVAKGAVAAGTIAEITARVDAFCACRVTPEHSRAVFLGPEGVGSTGRRGLLCIDFATVDPGTSRAIGRGLSEKGIDYLDAPISGGPAGAKDGTLSIMVGGEATALEKAGPILAPLSKGVFHMGANGTGVTAKLCNNIVSLTTHALLAEAMVFGVKAGIDARALYNVLSNSTAASRTLERAVAGHILPRDFRPAAFITTVIKDLECAVNAARDCDVPLRLPAAALQCFVEAVESGHGEADVAAVILPMEERAGVRVGPA